LLFQDLRLNGFKAYIRYVAGQTDDRVAVEMAQWAEVRSLNLAVCSLDKGFMLLTKNGDRDLSNEALLRLDLLAKSRRFA